MRWPGAAAERFPLLGKGVTGLRGLADPGALRKWHSKRLLQVRAGVLSWLLFSIATCLFAFAFHRHAALICAMVGFTAMVSLLAVLAGLSSGKHERAVTGCLCIASLALAAAVGLFVAWSFMHEYWRLASGASVAGVAPGDRPWKYLDATRIHFQEDAFVDGRHALGRLEGGGEYCVAPVVGAVQPTEVAFWAVGKDCCLARAAFACGDALQPHARAGVALDLGAKEEAGYRRAVAEAEAEFGLRSSRGALLLHWVEDPNVLMENLWSGATTLVTLAIVLSLVASTVLSVYAHRLKNRRDWY